MNERILRDMAWGLLAGTVAAAGFIAFADKDFQPCHDCADLGASTVRSNEVPGEMLLQIPDARSMDFTTFPPGWEIRLVLTEDGGWDLHCNGHCRAVGDGGVIEVRW